jgi:hypothetical protein
MKKNPEPTDWSRRDRLIVYVQVLGTAVSKADEVFIIYCSLDVHIMATS